MTAKCPTRELQCKKIQPGSCKCYKTTMYGFDADECLVEEVNGLNADGVKTIGCCCGHREKQGYIQVKPEFVSKMLELGYEERPIDEDGNGQWCFKPRATLPSLNK